MNYTSKEIANVINLDNNSPKDFPEGVQELLFEGRMSRKRYYTYEEDMVNAVKRLNQTIVVKSMLEGESLPSYEIFAPEESGSGVEVRYLFLVESEHGPFNGDPEWKSLTIGDKTLYSDGSIVFGVKHSDGMLFSEVLGYYEDLSEFIEPVVIS